MFKPINNQTIRNLRITMKSVAKQLVSSNPDLPRLAAMLNKQADEASSSINPVPVTEEQPPVVDMPVPPAWLHKGLMEMNDTELVYYTHHHFIKYGPYCSYCNKADRMPVSEEVFNQLGQEYMTKVYASIYYPPAVQATSS